MSVETFGIDYGIPETIDTFDAQEALNQYYNSMLNKPIELSLQKIKHINTYAK